MPLHTLSPTKRGLLLGCSCFFLVMGLSLLLANSTIFLAIYKSQLVLGPTSASYPMWHTLPEPMLMSAYLYKVLNPEEVSAGQKPRLEQVGPYVFTEQHDKSSIVWNSNGTVSYRQIRTWHFQPQLSNGTLEDQVTILNSVAASLGAMVREKVPKFWIPGTNGLLLAIKERLFVTKTVGEIIFDGYHDPLFDVLDDMPWIKKFLPPGSTPEKFGFFYQRNGSDVVDGTFNMYTGLGDVGKMGEVFSWNSSPQGVFPGRCGEVHGSAGEFYPPGLPKTHIDMFSNDLCRTIRLNYQGEVDVLGINSFEFTADRSFFANGTENPANSCYEPVGQSLRSGVYNTSLCRFGAPVFISQPHFLQADPWYLDQVHGLQPDPALHGTAFRVEPNSGVPTSVVARFQLNVRLEAVKGITLLEDVPTVFFPVMWFENKAGVPADLVTKMSLLASLPTILASMGWAEVGLAFSLAIITVLCLLSRGRQEDTSPILNVEEQGDEEVFVQKDED